MPDAASFRRFYGLHKGLALGAGLTISAAHVGHVVERQNQRYSFPIQLDLSGAGSGRGASAKSVAAAFAAHIKPKQHGILMSAYGSPYECSIGSEKAAASEGKDGGWTLTAKGRAVRRRDLPTVAQQKAEEHQRTEPSKEEVESLKPEYRVIKSRFGSSKCSVCGETIEQGLSIAKREGEAGRGGWAHARCLLQQRGGRAGGKRSGGKAGAAGGKGKVAAAAAAARGAKESGEVAGRARGGRKQREPLGASGGVKKGRVKKAAVSGSSMGGGGGKQAEQPQGRKREARGAQAAGAAASKRRRSGRLSGGEG